MRVRVSWTHLDVRELREPVSAAAMLPRAANSAARYIRGPRKRCERNAALQYHLPPSSRIGADGYQTRPALRWGFPKRFDRGGKIYRVWPVSPFFFFFLIMLRPSRFYLLEKRSCRRPKMKAPNLAGPKNVQRGLWAPAESRHGLLGGAAAPSSARGSIG